MAVTLVVSGMVPFTELAKSAPISNAFESVHLKWATYIINVVRRPLLALPTLLS
jgi:hypothetical protein